MMEVYEHEGNEYQLGCLPRTAPVGALPLLADTIQLIPKEKWTPVDFSAFVRKILDQNGHGACVGFGSTSGMMVARKAAGLSDTDLSPWDLYARICGGRDAGASIHDALVALQKDGVADAASVPSYTLSTTRSAAQKLSMGKHKILEAFDCPTPEAMATAIQLGFATPFGVSVTTSWTPAADGWITPKGGVRGGHCILGTGLVYKNGKWGVKFCNSWTESFGLKGFGIYPLDLIDGEYADSWCIRSVTYAES